MEIDYYEKIYINFKKGKDKFLKDFFENNEIYFKKINRMDILEKIENTNDINEIEKYIKDLIKSHAKNIKNNLLDDDIEY